jgi:hypothetical protein
VRKELVKCLSPALPGTGFLDLIRSLLQDVIVRPFLWLPKAFEFQGGGWWLERGIPILGRGRTKDGDWSFVPSAWQGVGVRSYIIILGPRQQPHSSVSFSKKDTEKIQVQVK